MTRTRIATLATLAILAVALSACAAGREKEQMGGLVGAGLGALAGSQIGSGTGQLVAIGLGTLAGAYVGGEVGRQLDERDRLLAGRATRIAYTAPVGQTIAWDNPDSGNSGTVTTLREGTHTGTGAYCREYQQTVTVGGERQSAYGTACRQPDGSWEIAN